MNIFPKFLTAAAGRVEARVPERFRRTFRISLAVLAVAFLAFELSRIWIALRAFLFPLWVEQAGKFAALFDFPPWIAAVAVASAILVFVAPIAGAVLLWRFLKSSAAKCPATDRFAPEV